MIKRYTVIGLFIFMAVGISSAEVLISTDEALKKIYPQAQVFDKKIISFNDAQMNRIREKASSGGEGMSFENVVFYTVKKDGQMIGYVLEDAVPGKWGLIHFLAGVTPEGKISEVIVLDYKEDRGRPIAKKRFLRQYAGKAVQDPLVLNKDIDGISGATVSSLSLTNGVKKLLFVFEEVRPFI